MLSLSRRLLFPAFLGLTLLLTQCGPGDDSVEAEAPETPVEAEEEKVVQNWPLFRRDPEMQGNSVEDLKSPLEIAWTFEPPVEEGKRRPPFKASPIIAGSRVFVGGQDSVFYCLDLATGELLWKFDAEGTITAPGAVVGERVFFGDTYGFVYGLDVETGTEQWRLETDDKIEGGINALEVTDPKTGEKEWQIFFGSHDFNLYAVAAESGERRWKHETDNYVMATPSIEASLPAITFGGCDNFFHVVSAVNGRSIHQIELGQAVANSAAIRDGIAYVTHYGGEVVAIDVRSGEVVWKVETGVEYHGSPAVNDTLVIVPGTDKRVAAYDRVTGEEAWAFQGRRDFEASPLICESAIWIGGMDARLYAIDPQSGEEIWNFDVGTQMLASPALSAGVLVICGEDGLVYGFRSEGSVGPEPLEKPVLFQSDDSSKGNAPSDQSAKEATRPPVEKSDENVPSKPADKEK